MLCATLGQNAPCFHLFDRLSSSSGSSFLRLGFLWYGAIVRPHGRLNLLEVRTILMPGGERRWLKLPLGTGSMSSNALNSERTAVLSKAAVSQIEHIVQWNENVDQSCLYQDQVIVFKKACLPFPTFISV